MRRYSKRAGPPSDVAQGVSHRAQRIRRERQALAELALAPPTGNRNTKPARSSCITLRDLITSAFLVLSAAFPIAKLILFSF